MFFLKEQLVKHIKNNSYLYVFLFIVFMIGTTSGAFTVNNLKDVQKEELINYLTKFHQIKNSVDISTVSIFKQSLLNNFQTVFILWVLGATIIGIPLIFIVIFARGFVLGFSLSILISEYKFKGILVILASVLPQNIFIILGIIFISATSINFSLYILKNRKSGINDLISQFISYTFVVYSGFLVIILGSLIESYLSLYILLLN